MINIPNVTHTFAPNTTAQSAQVNTNFGDLEDAIRTTFVFTISGTLVTGSNLTPELIVPTTLTIEKAYLSVKTAPTDAAILVDINKNGTSIWADTQANRVTIADGAIAGTQISFDTTSLSDGDILTIDIDQIGSTIAGADMTIQVKCS